MARRILIGVGVALGVVVALAVAFIVFFPKDAAVARLQQQVQASTGRTLALDPDVSVSLYPNLGFTARAVRLSNPPGMPEGDFLAADAVTFAVALMPLLGGDIQVRRLSLENPVVNLLSTPDGASNWTFPQNEQAGEGGGGRLESLQLRNVRLSGGRLTYQGGEGEPVVLDGIDATLELDDLDAPGELKIEADYRGERLRATLQIETPRAVLEQGATGLRFNLRSDLAAGEFVGQYDMAAGALTGSLAAEGGSMRRVLAWLGAEMGEGAGFGSFEADAQMAAADGRLAFSDGTYRLDAVEAQGDVALSSAEDGRPRVDGALAIGNLDVNPYLPPAATSVDSGTAWSDAPIDLTGIRAIDADLALTLGALTFQNMQFSNASLRLRVTEGVADADLTQVSLYEGGGSARLVVDASRDVPQVRVMLDAADVQALPLLTAAIGMDRIEGRGRVEAALSGAGASQAAIMRSLGGRASFTFNDGAWRGVNLAEVARTVQSAISGGTRGESASTDFAEMSASFVLADGVAATQDLRLLNPFVRLEGAGLLDVGAQTIDMRITPRVVRTIEGQGGRQDAAGLGVPFRVSGPWTAPQFQPALGDLVRDQIQQRIGSVLGRPGAGGLGGVLGGGAEQQPTDQSAATPPPEQPSLEDRARGALGGILRP